ncbi:hypothetical protein ACFXAZ_33220 [Streptomyces sp. NPDC059477]|uniref:hypothetical protein n=1 Tax=Streptomyces sp. NPDC059477 TaxID=3346847 RepID=UPI0036747E03
MRRLDEGAPLRAAMKAAGLSTQSLAARTKAIDPTGEGLSNALVGFTVGGGKTAREECSDRAAELIAGALGRQVTDFFEVPVFTITESTSTRRTHAGEQREPLPEQLMDQKGLAVFLGKSSSWIDQQITDWAREHDGEDWPGLLYAGRSRRFDPYAVLAQMRKQRAAA